MEDESWVEFSSLRGREQHADSQLT